MTTIFERTPETEKAISYGAVDLLKEVLSRANQRREEASQRLLDKKPTTEDLMEMLFAGIGGAIKKLPFAPAGGLAKVGALENVRRTLPSSLRKFLIDEESAERLSNLGEMKRFKMNVAPGTGRVEEFYRPAVRLKEGKILWHPKAMLHADAVTLNLKGKKNFNYDDIVGSGGIGPDGSYYESDYIGDVFEDLWHRGVK